MKEEILNQLCEIAGKEAVRTKESLKNHTTFQVGGAADYFITPHTIEEVKGSHQFLKKNRIPYTILGNGSNILASDKGFRGAVLHLYHNMNGIEIDGCVIRAQAGALLSKIAAKAWEAELTGFEFAAGIPGTLGGAVVMNAGAYGGEMKQVIETVTVLDPEGNVLILNKEEMEFSYRKSIIGKKNYIVLEATIRLLSGEKEHIRTRMDELRELRIQKQPLEYGSAGSTFKRPEGYFAGKLIMDAGLSGFSIGGAQVSEKHCGFVINKGNATAADVIAVIRYTQAVVKEKFDVTLETEVKILGEF